MTNNDVENDDNGFKDNRSDWAEAFDQTLNHRNYLAGLNIDANEKVVSYLITNEQLQAMLHQDEKQLDGIRIYLGQKNFDQNQQVATVVVVPVQLDKSGEYFDYNIPDRNSAHFPNMPPPPRPCPPCGPIPSNGLNS
jgi:hypothetical protein